MAVVVTDGGDGGGGGGGGGGGPLTQPSGVRPRRSLQPWQPW